MKKYLLLITALILGSYQIFHAPPTWAKPATRSIHKVHGQGTVKGAGVAHGKGIAKGRGTAHGTGVVIYKDHSGKLHYKKGHGTVSGTGIAIGKGAILGRGKARGKGRAAGKK